MWLVFKVCQGTTSPSSSSSHIFPTNTFFDVSLRIRTMMGIVSSLLSQTFLSKGKFDIKDIPDLTGKVIIVTGANIGVSQNYALGL